MNSPLLIKDRATTMIRYSASLIYLLFGAINLTQAENYYEGPAFVSDSLAQLSDVAFQCVDEKMMSSSTDPFDIAFSTMENYCSDSQDTKFELALRKYEKCSGASLEDFIETFWSAEFGAIMTCSGYVYRSAKSAMDDYEKNGEMKDLPFKERMPEECIDSLMGNNAFGNFFRENWISPKREYRCLKTLGEEVPNCTLRRWPVPIVGAVFRFFSCAAPNVEVVSVSECNDELEVMNKCLPSVGEIKKANKGSCKTWTETCTLGEINEDGRPVMHMMLPAPLSSSPFPDTCADEDINARYKAYQQACFPKEDLELWNEAKTSAFGGLMTSSKSKRSKSSSSSGKFLLYGLVLGIVGTVGAAVLIDRRNRNAGDASPGDGIIDRLKHQYTCPAGATELT